MTRCRFALAFSPTTRSWKHAWSQTLLTCYPAPRGEHVALIQAALVRIRALEPADAHVEAGSYGPKTAAAVLAYKRRFRIINGAYQSQPDNIVGRMTIASLDDAIAVLDGVPGTPRVPGIPVHPRSPPVDHGRTSKKGQALCGGPSDAVAAQSGAGVAQAGTGYASFAPPLSTLPPDVQEAVRRSNDAKTPDELLLYPFLAKHEGPLSAADLSARFAREASATQILRDLHSRMLPFGIWQNILTIVSVYTGIGSRGLFCVPFDHEAFMRQMIALTTGPRIGPSPLVVPLQVPLSDSRFCRDMLNVHGPRDSFREIVKRGPGLHICITQRAARWNTPCDLHIDEVQQGQVCSNGYCIPIINGQTIKHLQTVRPWLEEQARKWFSKS